MAVRKEDNRSCGDPWFGQKTLSYFPVKAFPKPSSSRLLERTMIGDWPKYSSIATNCSRRNGGKVPERIICCTSSAPSRKVSRLRWLRRIPQHPFRTR